MGFINLNVPMGNIENLQMANTANLSGIVSYPLLSTGYYLSSNWIAPKTGNIDSIGIVLTALSGTLPTTNLSIEGINTSKGADDIQAATTGISLAVSSGFTWFPIPSYQVKEGSGYSCVIRCTGTVGSTNCGFFGMAYLPNNTCGLISNFPVRFLGSLSLPVGYPLIVPRYDDGQIPKGFIITNTGSVGFLGTPWNSGTALNYKGLLFQSPIECKIQSFWIATSQISANSHLEVKLYDTNNNLLINRYYAANKNYNPNAGSLLVELASGLIIKKNTNYRLVISPSGTANVLANYMTMNSTAELQNFYGFSGCMTEGSGTNTNIAWKNYNNSTDGYRAYVAMPFLSQIAFGGRRRGTGA